MESDFDLCFRYYEKAIEGRNSHYGNYNAWVNLYSIFTGAIFIAYYTIKTGTEQNETFLPCVLAILGLITSVCWLEQIRGYYYWMLSWIKVVHKYEERLNEIRASEETEGNENTENYYVYSVLKDEKKSIFNKNISTQKITAVFVICIIIGWCVLLVNLLYKPSLPNFIQSILPIAVLVVTFLIINTLSSSTEGMFKDIYGKEKWDKN